MMRLDKRNMHPLRQRLNSEIHWLPYEPVDLPAVAAFILVTDVQEEQEHRWIQHLASLEKHVTMHTTDGVQWLRGERWRASIQRHVETSRYLFLAENKEGDGYPCDDPFAGSIWNRLPAEAMDTIPGQVLTAAKFVLHPSAETEASSWVSFARNIFGRQLVGSYVGRSESALFSDFMPDDDGFIRFLIFSRARTPEQHGRLLGRLLDIEAYRMLALLGLPAANRLLAELPQLEIEFQRLSNEISAQKTADEQALQDLLALGLKVERHLSENARRFTASKAYFELLERRLEALETKPFEAIPPVKPFLTRRLESARDTIHDVGHWLEQLSGRIGALGELLRTRVSVRQEEQNQQLLSALNRRFSLQLRLQQAAELLSVAIFTYYSTHLLADLIAFLGGLAHMEINELTVRGISAPLLAAGAIWWLLRRRRSHPPASD